MPIKPYDHTTYPANGALGSSTALRNELDSIEAGFDLVAVEIETALTGSETAAATATTQAGIATTQAGIATTQAGLATTNGAAQVTLATTQAGIATTQAGISSTQAGIATTKAGEALSSANSAAATLVTVNTVYDNFDDRYLGTKAVAPTLDNDGNALQQGTLYWDSTLSTLRGYNGASWVSLPATTAINITNTPSGNLSAANVQAALNELQADIDTRATTAALTAHIDDTDDAHDASAISNTPSGNLAATTVQAALNELQTDINAREISINAATAKATPVDADAMGLIDSAAANVLKKVTWSNIKATLKTYFDTIYATAAALTAHTGAAAGAHAATAITNAASGNLTSTTVQASLQELQTDIDTRALASNLGLGYGQTWQNVTASRAAGTTYTNSTGKPIQVAIYAGGASGGTITLTISGQQVGQHTNGSAVTNTGQVFGIVPDGQTYSITLSSWALTGWKELR